MDKRRFQFSATKLTPVLGLNGFQFEISAEYIPSALDDLIQLCTAIIVQEFEERNPDNDIPHEHWEAVNLHIHGATIEEILLNQAPEGFFWICD